LRTSRGPSPDSAATAVTGLAKITRICTSEPALPFGEIDAIQDGNDGFGSASTDASLGMLGVGTPQDATANAAAASSTECEDRRGKFTLFSVYRLEPCARPVLG
jgi:hypothetical protein